jgi:ketosteroid isomerase-like protein
VSDTERVARSYFDAWTSGDGDTVASLLSPDFEGRERFLDRGAFPADASTTMVAEAYQDDVAFQMYDARRGDRTVRIVEQLTVRDGRIASSVFVTDATAFASFLT